MLVIGPLTKIDVIAQHAFDLTLYCDVMVTLNRNKTEIF